jgi:hypothetical protein
MGGWKTKLAGVGGILSGLAMVVASIVNSPFDFNNLWQGVLVIVGGLGLLGVGHKLQKLLEAIKPSNE